MPRKSATALALATILAVGGTWWSPVSGQEKPAPTKKKSLPRTADGKPDLQGVWDFRTLTPLQRPKEYADRPVLSDAEAVEFERKNALNFDNREETPTTVQNGAKSSADVDRAYNDFWWDFGKKVVGTRRTSLIVDPPDGKIPPLTPEAQKRSAERAEAYSRAAFGPEDRGVGERCILGFNSGPPMLPSAYNNNVQIFQGDGHIALLNEMVHNARIIQMDGRPHLPGSVRQWVGDSRGRWDGDTLVVETTNFLGATAFPNSGPGLRLTERFSRTDADTLLYEFTVDDPATWTKPWTVQVPMERSAEPMYEYACHEGNYGMTNLLSGARAVDADAAKTTK